MSKISIKIKKVLNLRTFSIILYVIAIVFISGCGRAKEGNKKVELRFATINRGADYQAIYERILSEFERRYPHIKVKTSFEVGDYYVKLQTQIAGGAAPDVFHLASKTVATFGVRQVLMDLRPYIEKDKFSLVDFYPIALEEGSVPSGEIYSLPDTGGAEVLYYNKGLFDSVKLGYPNESWSWQDLLEAAKKTTVDLDGDGKTDIFGFTPPLQGWMATLPWIWANGGDLFNVDRTRCIIYSPEAIEAVQFLLDLRNKYRVAPTVVERGTIGDADLLFNSGRSAMFIYHAEEIPFQLRKSKNLRWDISPIPKGRKGRIPRYTGVSLSIWSGSRHKNDAWELVKFLTSKEVLEELAHVDWMPARRSVAESPDYIKDSTPYHEDVFVESVKYARVLPNIPELGHTGEINRIWDTQMDLAELEKVSVDKALKEIEVQINKVLNKKGD